MAARPAAHRSPAVCAESLTSAAIEWPRRSQESTTKIAATSPLDGGHLTKAAARHEAVTQAAVSHTAYEGEWVTPEDGLLQGLFIGWDAEFSDDVALCYRDVSGNPAAEPYENVQIPPPSGCAAPEAAESSTALTSTTSPSSSPHHVSTTKPKLTSTSARQKHEMQLLRREAHELSETLQQMRKSMCTAWPRDCEFKPQPPLPAFSMWKSTAEKHHQRLKQAQRENLQLELRALDHRRLAKSLKRALNKRISTHSVRRCLVYFLLLSSSCYFD